MGGRAVMWAECEAHEAAVLAWRERATVFAHQAPAGRTEGSAAKVSPEKESAE
jgi:hypothetical protein